MTNIEKKNITKKNLIEDNIRAQRLKEAEMARKELENKLKMVTNQIEELKISSDENSSTPIKKPTKLSKEEFKERENKAYDFVQKLNKERKEKEKRDLQRREQLDKEMKLEIDAYYRSLIENEEKAKNEKQHQIFEKLENQMKKKEEKVKIFVPNHYSASFPNNENKLFTDNSNQKHPNYFDVKPKQKILNDRAQIDEGGLPELERKKRELLKIRDINSGNLHVEPVLLKGQLKELLHHSKPKKIIIMSPDPANKKVYQSSVLKKVKEDDKDEKTKNIQKNFERKILHDKQVGYGRVIQKSILPKIDRVNHKSSPKKKRIKEVVMTSLEYKDIVKNRIIERNHKADQMKNSITKIHPLDEELMHHASKITAHGKISSNLESDEGSPNNSNKFNNNPKILGKNELINEINEENPLKVKKIQKVNKSNKSKKNQIKNQSEVELQIQENDHLDSI